MGMVSTCAPPEWPLVASFWGNDLPETAVMVTQLREDTKNP